MKDINEVRKESKSTKPEFPVTITLTQETISMIAEMAAVFMDTTPTKPTEEMKDDLFYLLTQLKISVPLAHDIIAGKTHIYGEVRKQLRETINAPVKVKAIGDERMYPVELSAEGDGTGWVELTKEEAVLVDRVIKDISQQTAHCELCPSINFGLNDSVEINTALKNAVVAMRDEIQCEGLLREDRSVRARLKDGRRVVFEFSKDDFSCIKAYACNLSSLSDSLRRWQQGNNDTIYNDIPTDVFIELLGKFVIDYTIIPM